MPERAWKGAGKGVGLASFIAADLERGRGGGQGSSHIDNTVQWAREMVHGGAVRMCCKRRQLLSSSVYGSCTGVCTERERQPYRCQSGPDIATVYSGKHTHAALLLGHHHDALAASSLLLPLTRRVHALLLSFASSSAPCNLSGPSSTADQGPDTR